MDAELRDAERAAAGGDPIEAERLEAIRARTAVAPPKRQGKADRETTDRLRALLEERATQHDRSERTHHARTRAVANEVTTWLALPSRERGRARSREWLAHLSAEEVEAKRAERDAFAAWEASAHGWHRAVFGECPLWLTATSAEKCKGPLGPDGRCTRCEDTCGCDGCSGAL